MLKIINYNWLKGILFLTKMRKDVKKMGQNRNTDLADKTDSHGFL